MNINLTLLGKILFCLAIVMALLGYYLGRRKTQTPILTSVIAALSVILPPIALIFLIVLVMKDDVDMTSKG